LILLKIAWLAWTHQMPTAAGPHQRVAATQTTAQSLQRIGTQTIPEDEEDLLRLLARLADQGRCFQGTHEHAQVVGLLASLLRRLVAHHVDVETVDAQTQTGPLLVDGSTQLAPRKPCLARLDCLPCIGEPEPEPAESAPPMEVMGSGGDKRRAWGVVPEEKSPLLRVDARMPADPTLQRAYPAPRRVTRCCMLYGVCHPGERWVRADCGRYCSGRKAVSVGVQTLSPAMRRLLVDHVDACAQAATGPAVRAWRLALLKFGLVDVQRALLLEWRAVTLAASFSKEVQATRPPLLTTPSRTQHVQTQGPSGHAATPRRKRGRGDYGGRHEATHSIRFGTMQTLHVSVWRGSVPDSLTKHLRSSTRGGP